MKKSLTCIECPQGCRLEADLENGYVIKVTGEKCPKGLAYAKQEIENPMRTLTSTVTAAGLNLPRVPVRTSRPIPKNRLAEAMRAIRALRLDHPVAAGEAIQKDFLGLQVDLIATRTVAAGPN